MTFDPALAACEARSTAEFESAVLDALAKVVGFGVGFFAYRGAMPTTVGLDAARLSSALEPGNPYEAELLPVKRAALAGRGVAVDTAVLGSRRVQKMAYFREFAKPLGGTQTMLGYLSLRDQPLGALMLGRTGGAFRDLDVAALEQVLPGLAVARASFGLPGLASRPLGRVGGWALPRRHWKVVRLGESEIDRS